MTLRIIKISDKTNIQVFEGLTLITKETFNATNLDLENEDILTIVDYGSFDFDDFDLANSDVVLQAATTVRELRDALVNNDYFV